MREFLLGLGIIMLLAGAVVFSVSNQVVETTIPESLSRVEHRPYGEWIVSARYEKDDKLVLVFKGPSFEGPLPNGGATMLANITDPTGAQTQLMFFFHRSMVTGDPDLNVTLLHDGGGLKVDDKLDEPGGITQYEGNYTAHVYCWSLSPHATAYYPPNGVLPFLELLKWVEQREFPSRDYLPIGVVLIVGGIVLSIWAGKSSDGSSKTKRKRGARSARIVSESSPAHP